MVILHAGFLDDDLLIWAEASDDDAAAPKPRRGKADARPVPRHPFAATTENVVSMMAALGVGDAELADEGVAYAWLPSAAGRPMPSSPLLGIEAGPTKDATLSPWRLPLVRLLPQARMDLLARVRQERLLAPGRIAGDDLVYWTQAARLAGALVARQQFLPGVAVKDGVYRAVWEPVVAGQDGERLAQLARAMPASCRAIGGDAKQPPDTAAVDVLTAFVTWVVDFLVRHGGPASDHAGWRSPKRRRARTRAELANSAYAFDSQHDQWLYALTADDATLHGSEAELRQLAEQVAEWRRPVTASVAAPWRLFFRLEEPEEVAEGLSTDGLGADGEWQVRYLLQPRDDLSLLVPADEAWKGKLPTPLRKAAPQLKEHLLAQLGQAATIDPPVLESLKSGAPAGYTTNTSGAYDFLTDKAYLLEQAGLGVLLPSWWARRGGKTAVALRAEAKSPPMQGKAGLSLESIMQVQWQAALAGEPITEQELQELAKLKAPLVRFRGQWVQVNTEEIEAALAFWKKRRKDSLTVRDAMRLALGAAPEGDGRMPVEGVSATGWVGDLLKQLEQKAGFAELEPPAAFQGTLRAYQQRGYSWLAFLRQWGLGACLADDMGLGKTVQLLALVQRDWEAAKASQRRPTLLVCPTSVVANWQKEAARFTPDLPVLVHHGAARIKDTTFARRAAKQALVVSSYALLHRDLELLKAVAWDGVVLDEAQNIKNANTRQAQAARALPAQYKVALTGTPVENNVGDLWSLMQFLNPGLLGGQAEFKRRFFVPIQTGSDPEAAQRLQRLTGPFILRRLKTDRAIISDLPEKLEMKVFCNLTREQASLYAAVVREATPGLDEKQGIDRRGLVLATLMKLKQVCNHPAQLLGDNSAIPGRSGKLARLTEMMDEVLQAGDRALIFTQFREMGDILQRHLQESFGEEVLFLHGGVTKKVRDQMVERFQSEGRGPRLFLLSLKAGGVGLNLTSANHVFHFDRWWNPAVENQATDRAFRIGQRKNVQVHKFLCAGTVEEKIDALIESKQEIAARVVGTGEGWLTELSTTQLKEMFALSRDAVAE